MVSHNCGYHILWKRAGGGTGFSAPPQPAEGLVSEEYPTRRQRMLSFPLSSPFSELAAHTWSASNSKIIQSFKSEIRSITCSMACEG